PGKVSHFDSIIASSPPELVRYNAEIDRLQKTLHRLVSERAALQQYMNGCRSISSPVRSLPPEVLAEIFALCSPDPASFYD
ncbi:hypothetical protein B0H19DRAFT_883342, partial [Mycena capillaripes]